MHFLLVFLLLLLEALQTFLSPLLGHVLQAVECGVELNYRVKVGDIGWSQWHLFLALTCFPVSDVTENKTR